MKYFAYIILYSLKIYDRLLMHIYKSLFCECGKNVTFYPTKSDFYYKNISIGSNVYIGERASFISKISHIIIKDNVLFGPNVTIRGGNHSTHIIGKLLIDYKECDKNKSDDENVIIEEDVWVGTGVIILKGVNIGRGSIIGAGSVITKSIPPYSVVAGVPGRIIKQRWSNSEIIMHEKYLYSEINKTILK